MELRRLRQAAGLSAEDAANQLELSPSTISRGETGVVNIHPRDVDAMLRLYGVGDKAKREALLALSRRSRERGWWHSYRRYLREDVVNFISLEDGANSIRTFQTMLVPGFLQTEEYTSAVASVFPRPEPPDTVEKLIEVRLKRQQRLHGPNPVPLHAVLDESVLHRPIGGTDVMHAQLHHLLDIAKADNVTLQVLPYAAGAHAGLGGPFTMFGFPEPMHDLAIVHVENQKNLLLIEDTNDIEHYEVAFHRVQKSALPVPETMALVEEIAEGL